MWDQRYHEPGFFYGTEPNDFLAKNAQRVLKAGGAVLSLGEGEGRNGVYLAQLGFAVTGVDGSSVGLEKAQRLAKERGVPLSTVVADLATFDLGRERWDGIVSLWCHLPSALRRRVHGAVAAALKPGGVFLLEAYRPEQLKYRTGGPSDVDLLPTKAQLRDELAGLQLIEATERLREVHEGAHHGGTSAVVQIIAKRSGGT